MNNWKLPLLTNANKFDWAVQPEEPELSFNQACMCMLATVWSWLYVLGSTIFLYAKLELISLAWWRIK